VPQQADGQAVQAEHTAAQLGPYLTWYRYRYLFSDQAEYLYHNLEYEFQKLTVRTVDTGTGTVTSVCLPYILYETVKVPVRLFSTVDFTIIFKRTLLYTVFRIRIR